MSYDTEFKRLQKIITADDSTDEQRETARVVKETLINNSIKDAFIRIKNRTTKYNDLIEKLKAIINDIKVNKLTTALADIDGVMQEAVEESEKEDAGGDKAG
ncbi:MAG: hypothetical protein KKB30_06710 [Proteobacteria bacterium]|nr:hypothetical protein [Pseudomonadota bacterium]MBU1715408.1 hypothetical protein [Pseudomonadota bacterium]